MAVALVDAGDEDLADVPREVEVDVGHRGGFVVQEAAGEEVGLHRVDVGEAGEIADDRADAGAPPAPRGQDGPRRSGAAHLDRHFAGQLEHVAVEEEEAGEVEPADRRQLLAQSRLRLAPARVAQVALVHHVGADAGELPVGRLVLGAGVAVAEVRGEVEGEALGEADGLGDRARMLTEARGHRGGGGERRGRVAAAQRLARLQRFVQPDRDQRVLQVGARAGVRVDVAGGDGGNAEPLGKERQPAVARPVPAPVGTLQLDPEAVAAEGGEEPAPQLLAERRVPALEGPRQRPVPRAPRQADEPLGVPLDFLERRPSRFRDPRRVVPRMRVRRGQEPAKVPIPVRVLHQQRHVRQARLMGRKPVRLLFSSFGPINTEGQLGAGDRAEAEADGGMGELHRAPDPVVVGQRQRRIAELRGGARQLQRGRGAVEEGERRVGVQLDVGRGARHRSSGLRPAGEPAPAAGIAEDGERAAVGHRQLEVVAAQRARRPPAVLDQPLLAHRLDRRRVDRARGAHGIGEHRDRPWLVESARPGHRAPITAPGTG